MQKNESNAENSLRQPGETHEAINHFIETAHAVDLAAWLAKIPRDLATEHVHALSVPRRADTFRFLPLDIQWAIAQTLSRKDFVELITRMNRDDRVHLFKRLSPLEQQHLLGELALEDREDIRRLSLYAEETAGALMTSDYVTMAAHMSAHEAIELLRCKGATNEAVYRCYILDDDRRLIGSIELHELVLAPADTQLKDIMEHAPVSVEIDMDQEEVAKVIARYHLSALPVVDGSGQLYGIITHDDAAEAMQREMTEDFQKISTVRPFSQSVREAGIGVLYSKRIFWLAILVFGNLFSGAGIAYFEETILAYVSLVFFLPLLIDSGGNAGSQSATLMVRAMATGDVTLKDWRALLVRELAIAIALGATMAFIVFPVGMLRGGSEVALVVGLTMVMVVMVGSLVGMSLPFLLSHFRLDPATAAAPLVTTISDVVGVLVYFSIATAILHPTAGL